MNAAIQADPYAAVFKARGRKLSILRKLNPTIWVQLRRYYQEHIDDFINDWGLTFDPRNVRRGLPVVLPFNLDPKQREWVQFTYQNWRDGQYALTEKSRDVGLSWLSMAFSCALCVLFDHVVVGVGSFKQEKVDQRGDMGSLLEKARFFLEGLPRELCAGFDRDVHSAHMRLFFPATQSAIIGEVGDSIGRGARTSVYFVDEAAHLLHDQLIDAALSKTTDCRQDLSSVFGMSNTFAERAHDGTSRKFTFHWKDNPRFTQAMYEDFLEQWGPVITAQELDINYQASVEGVVIPAEWVNAAIDSHLVLGLQPTGEKAAGFDVADRGIDKNAFASRHGILVEYAEQFSGKATGDIYASVERVFMLCDMHGCLRFTYDADGVGAGVMGDARKVNEARAGRMDRELEVLAFRGSSSVVQPGAQMVEGRRNEDFFENLKAQAWWALRIRFQLTFRAVQAMRAGHPIQFDPSDIISIASDFKDRAQLIVELSRPVYTQSKSGKLLIDKTPDGVASPNLADAVMMLFAPGKPLTVSDSFLHDFGADDDLNPMP